MKIRSAFVAVLVLGGCASPPAVIERAPGSAASQASDTMTSGRARELVLHALSQVGVPYRYGGSVPEEGFDCSGLVQYVYTRAGIRLPRTTYAMSVLGEPIAADALQPGDLVFFDTLRRSFSHVGIYIGDHRFVHAPTSGGVVQLVDMRERYWRSRYEGARRLAP